MNTLPGLFTVILNMSITASYVAVGVMIVRVLFKKAPKIFSYALWAVVLFRLICPLSFSSPFSFLGVLNLDSHNMIGMTEYVPYDIGLMEAPAVQSDTGSLESSVNSSLQQAIPISSVTPLQTWMDVLSFVWLAGILVLFVYSIMSYTKIIRRLDTATIVKDNIYESDRIGTAFVCGFVRPKIYVPVGVGGSDLSYILEHEYTHIRRRDHLIKSLAFFTLILHWFNPLIWLSFMLMSRDMEMSCDESVLRKMGEETKGSYSASLLSLSVKGTWLLTANPLAFGESHVKARIKNILNYKKPAIYLVLVVVVMLVVAAVAFMADPQKPFDLEKTTAEAMLFSTNKTDLLEIGKDAFDHYYASFMGGEIPEEYRITEYKLNHISLLAGDEKEFCVQVKSNYSTTGLYFLSANGSFIPDGTGGKCTGDLKEFRIKRLEKDKYQITSIGTGGGTQGLLPVDPEDQKTFVEENVNIIMSSPKESSNPQDYIDAHQIEYNAILSLDARALPYLFAEFEKGGQTGLKGHIMERLCRDILGGEDIKYANSDPQDWYDVLKEHMQGLASRNSLEFVQKSYPKAAFIFNKNNCYYAFDKVNFSDGLVEIAGQKLSYENVDLEPLYKTLTSVQVEQMMYRAVIYYKSVYQKEFTALKRFSSTELKNEIDKWRKNEKTRPGIDVMMQLDNYTEVSFPMGITAPTQYNKKYIVILTLDKDTSAHITFEIYREGTPQVTDFGIALTNTIN